MQTAVQKIIEQIDEEVQVLSNLYGSEIKGRLIALAFAKKRCLEMLEMEKQQIIDAYANGSNDRLKNIVKDYFSETYGSKGNFKQFSLYEHKETITSADTKLSTSFLENTPTSSQTEISDEEIEKQAYQFKLDYENVGVTEFEVSAFIIGMKKYREQLKQRQ